MATLLAIFGGLVLGALLFKLGLNILCWGLAYLYTGISSLVNLDITVKTKK